MQLFRRITLGAGAGISLAIAVWFGGFLLFTASLPRQVEDPTTPTDVIVVLTGGQGRTAMGIELLHRQLAPRLFISGVHYGVDVMEILRLFRSDARFEKAIFLDYQAENTRENARETARWMKAQGLTSLRLVTGSYHMPRSLLEFHRVLPSSVVIIPHPVFSDHVMSNEWWNWPGTAALLLSEYHKTVATWLRHRLFFWEFIDAEGGEGG